MWVFVFLGVEYGESVTNVLTKGPFIVNMAG